MECNVEILIVETYYCEYTNGNCIQIERKENCSVHIVGQFI